MNVVWLSVKEGTPAKGYWDQKLLESFFEKETHYIAENDIWPNLDSAVVIIPGAYQADYVDKINQFLNTLDRCVVIVTSDEENNFPLDKLKHPNMKVFANYYHPKYKSEIYWLPIGAANTFNIPLQEKIRNFAFAGQVTHPAREYYIKQLRDRTDGELIETKGFAQGLSPEEYYKFLASAKVVPSPAGNVSPDAFRTYEAISAGAVPIPTAPSWHNTVFGPVPFPVLDKYEQVNGYMDDAIEKYPKLNNQVQAWWIMARRKIKEAIFEAMDEPKPLLTAMVPCSPVKSHPSIEIIDETIKSIVSHQPDIEIIVTFDGVREEQEDRRADYEEFKRRFLWECYHNPLYKNVVPLIFNEHMHQVKMAREALEYIDTDMVLYCEQDTPLTDDREIDWEKCFQMIEGGEADMIRFHFEAFIPKVHEYMMIGEPQNGFLRTYQWSQRPHLISRAYFLRVLKHNFSKDAVCFIEDKMHGVVSNAFTGYGINGWYQHRIWIYHPEGDIKRSYHTDGRAGESKWDTKQKW